ncbi:MAG: histidine kinase, partial [Thermoanaerobaculia bacterium]|nr:histidine kinase [Thermoanaerobaculia bacterium]
LRGVFNHAVYIIDESGEILISDPAMLRAPREEWLRGAFGHTGIRSRSADPSALVALETFEKDGRTLTLIAEAQPAGSGLSAILQDLASDPSLHIVIVDRDAKVIAAPDQRQLNRAMHTIPGLLDRVRARRPLIVETTHCPLCAYSGSLESRNLTVMIPLEVAPWSIVVQQHEPTILSLAETFLVGFISVTAIVGIMGLLLSRSFSQSVIAPIDNLSSQAERMQEGDLETPIVAQGDREVQLLAGSLDDAREKIRHQMVELRSLNEDLEALVGQRTDELSRRIEDLRILLELSMIASREHDPHVFLPESLELLASKFDVGSIALVVASDELEPTEVFTPEGQEPPDWLIRNRPAPNGWHRRKLTHLGKDLGEIYYLEGPDPDHPLLDAMCREIAGALHGATLLQDILANNARRQELVRRLLRAGEEERRRIARELHDEISQLLTVIQISLDQLVAGERSDVGNTVSLIARTQKEIHRIIHDLRPTLLDDLGLAAAVKWYADSDLAERGIDVRLEVEDDLELPEEIEITVFRILQECITNILRHSQARNVYIELFANTSSLVMVVEDDGIGFDTSRKEHGSGLTGMRERAALVGGTIRIDRDQETAPSV